MAPIILLIGCPMIVFPILGLIAMTNGWNFIEFEVVPGFDLIWAFLAILMLPSLYSSLGSIWKHRQLRTEQLTVLDESGRYLNEFARTTTSQKIKRAGIFVLWLAAIMYQYQEFSLAQQSVPWISVIVFSLGHRDQPHKESDLASDDLY